ncbi:MAG: hypothetical protein JWR69_3997 [Pedosphaera sp.]|nr:hypothetical protein [Pedosphaera sp.]
MSTKPSASTQLHWNYFLALEKDMEAISRYIEFCPDNLNTYSIELAHLLLSAASEVDTLAKCICKILDPKAKLKNIDDYRKVMKTGEDTEPNSLMELNARIVKIDPEKYKHRISNLKVYIPRYSLAFTPWESWANDTNPDWWHSYNKVKHERDQHYNKANLNNALNALAGLLAMNYVHCRLELTKGKPEHRFEYKDKAVTRRMQPHSSFLRFPTSFYDNPIAELAASMHAGFGAV